jgi:hypothetical protein
MYRILRVVCYIAQPQYSPANLAGKSGDKQLHPGRFLKIPYRLFCSEYRISPLKDGNEYLNNHVLGGVCFATYSLGRAIGAHHPYLRKASRSLIGLHSRQTGLWYEMPLDNLHLSYPNNQHCYLQIRRDIWI